MLTAAVKSTMGMTRSGSGSALAALGGGGQDLPQRKVLLLGAGMVTSPFVEYLLRRPENVVTVADMSLEVSKKLCHGRKRMLPVQLNVVAEAEKLEELIKEHDCIVSLVPAQFHTLVAEPALKHKRNMVTASYISPAMYALHDQAVAAKVCILNESGLDPGMMIKQKTHKSFRYSDHISLFHPHSDCFIALTTSATNAYCCLCILSIYRYRPFVCLQDAA